MGNMSYCRFTNTEMDLEDCKEQLIENECLTTLDEYGSKLSMQEFNNAIALIEACREIVEHFEDLDVYEAKEEFNQLETED